MMYNCHLLKKQMAIFIIIFMHKKRAVMLITALLLLFYFSFSVKSANISDIFILCGHTF